MKKIKDKKFWLKDFLIKESVSKKSVVSNLIVEIGEEILEKIIKEKYSKMI